MSLLSHHRTDTLLVKLIRLKSVIPLSQKKSGKRKIKDGNKGGGGGGGGGRDRSGKKG